jgi:hypothetical protein
MDEIVLSYPELDADEIGAKHVRYALKRLRLHEYQNKTDTILHAINGHKAKTLTAEQHQAVKEALSKIMDHCKGVSVFRGNYPFNIRKLVQNLAQSVIENDDQEEDGWQQGLETCVQGYMNYIETTQKRQEFIHHDGNIAKNILLMKAVEEFSMLGLDANDLLDVIDGTGDMNDEQ